MNPTADSEAVRDRAHGALVGLAVGDAVGTTLEFEHPGSFAPITDMVGGGPFGLAPGQWTDDTSMALCLAESLLDCGGHDASDQLRRYVLWRRDGYLSSTGTCFDIGGTTSSALAHFERTGSAPSAVNEESAANGSLMRLAPVAIRWFDDPINVVEMAAASSRTTHPASRPVDACKVLAAMTAALIRGTPFDEIVAETFWQWGELHPQIEAIVRGAWRDKQPPEIRGTGFCVDALEAALWAVGGATDFADAVLRAANLGDDADTTAAIAGQLAGARWGSSQIPDRWLKRLYWHARIESLADGLWRAATGDPMRWACDDRFHVWHGHDGVLGGEYPGAFTEADAREKLNLLVDAGVRTIVDLTTPADRLEPYAHLVDEIAAARRIALRRIAHPIPDVSIVDNDSYRQICDDIAKEIADDRAVFVHCWGGVGRTATVIGVYLGSLGMTGDAAIAHIDSARAATRKHSRRAPETPEQRDVITRFCR